MRTALCWVVTQRVITQKSAVLSCFAEEACNHATTLYWLSYCLIFKSYEGSKFSTLILLGKLKSWENGNNKNRKVIPVHTMKAYRWSRSVPTHIFNLDTRWCWTVGFTSLPFCPWCPLSRKLSGPQRLCVRFGEEKQFLCAGNRTPDVQNVTKIYDTNTIL
jgi:hypothetical protein